MTPLGGNQICYSSGRIGAHWDSSGLIGTHRTELIGAHWESLGIIGKYRESSGIIGNQWDSSRLNGTHPDSSWLIKADMTLIRNHLDSSGHIGQV